MCKYFTTFVFDVYSLSLCTFRDIQPLQLGKYLQYSQYSVAIGVIVLVAGIAHLVLYFLWFRANEDDGKSQQAGTTSNITESNIISVPSGGTYTAPSGPTYSVGEPAYPSAPSAGVAAYPTGAAAYPTGAAAYPSSYPSAPATKEPAVVVESHTNPFGPTSTSTSPTATTTAPAGQQSGQTGWAPATYDAPSYTPTSAPASQL